MSDGHGSAQEISEDASTDGSERQASGTKRRHISGDSDEHRSKKRVSRFLDIEAGVGSDDSEGEDEEDQFVVDHQDAQHVSDEELLTAEQDMSRILARRFEQLQQQKSTLFDPEAEERRIRELYGKKGKSAFVKESQKGMQPILSDAFLTPSITDPKLWLVKCKLGKETSAAHALLRISSGQGVLSAVCRDGLKGYLYIEAHKAADVAKAVHAAHLQHWIFTGATGQSLTLVPLAEMTEVLTITTTTRSKSNVPEMGGKPALPPIGSWVRIKRGKYVNDLAWVLDADDHRGLVRVKMIPRINASRDKAKGAAEQSNFGLAYKQGRPLQQLFDPKQASILGPLSRSRGMWVFGGETYSKDGYLIKYMKSESLIIDNIIPPKQHELHLFGEIGRLNSAVGSHAARKQRKYTFIVGDQVRIRSGEMIGLLGKVADIVDTGGNVLFKIALLDQSITKDLIDFAEKALEKYFEVGERVQRVDDLNAVINTGIVVSIEDAGNATGGSNVVAFNPLTGEQWQSASRNVQSLKEDSVSNSLTKSEFMVDDLVSVMDDDRNGSIGVVLRVDDGQPEQALLVVDVFGVNRRIPLTNVRLISHLVQTRHSNDGKLASGDAVQVIEQQKQQQSNLLVMHIQAESVFCKDPMTGQVTIHPLSALKRKGDDRRFKGQHQRPMAGFRLPPKGLLGKTVSISAGPYKGYLGIVKELTDTMARVELQSTSKLISVDRDRLITGGSALDRNVNYGGVARTPAHAVAPKTPSYASMGKTPAWNAGGKTPAWSMPGTSKTPAWNIPGAKTPTWASLPQSDAGKTPTWAGINKADNGNVEPQKPGIPTPSASRDPRRQQQTLPLWVQPGVEVASGDKKLIVTSISASTITVMDVATEASSTYSGTSELQRIIPAKKDRVLIYGDGQHQTGSLIGLDGSDAVVKLDGTNDFRIINVDDLAKLSQQQ